MRLSTDYIQCVQQLTLNSEYAESVDIAVEVIRDWIKNGFLDEQLVGWDIEKDLPKSTSFLGIPINWIKGKTVYYVTLNLRDDEVRKDEIKRFNERMIEILSLSPIVVGLSGQYSANVALERVATDRINDSIEKLIASVATDSTKLDDLCTEDRLLFLQIVHKYMKKLVEKHLEFQKFVTNTADRLEMELDGLVL
ncbi:MAG: hypothetical protein PVI90_11775 [Desulfobacteraceae bacterium]|jgi:hypothetical protein